MAWLEQKKSGTFHLIFRLGDEKFRRSLKTKCSREASARHLRVEENLRLVDAGRLQIPDNADLVTFLLSDGKLNQQARAPKRTRIGKLYQQYIDNLPEDSMEDNSLYTASIHMQHFVRNLPTNLELRDLTTADLQTYINTRARQAGRFGKSISAITIRKEIATLRSIWNWAKSQDYVSHSLPTFGLKYPKLDEKPPFRTREEIELEIEIGELSDEEQLELWHCLYLKAEEISEILSIIEQSSQYCYLYPMAAIAAYTGARRAELCRSLHKDIQLIQGKILLREKKRNRTKRTYRQVPIAETLLPVLRCWLESRKSGQATFPRERPLRRKHIQPEVEGGVLPPEAQYHLKQALRQTKWEVISGWHVFRHSFISNCATNGVDQRMIDDWVGHQTDEQRKRYRHLFPDSQKSELDRVF
jgi:integrase